LFSVIDIEATGGRPHLDNILEIAIINFDGEQVTERFFSLINPQIAIPPFIQKLTGISSEMVKDAPSFEEIAMKIKHFIGDRIIVAHNISFDYTVLRHSLKRYAITLNNQRLCSLQLSRKYIPEAGTYSLPALCSFFQIPLENKHRAMDDAQAAMQVLTYILHRVSKEVLAEQAKRGFHSEEIVGKIPHSLLENMPAKQGIFWMKDAEDHVIMVGRSADLQHNIIQQFSQNLPSQRRKEILEQVVSVKVELCENELYSRIREFEELLKYRPRFNAKLPHRNSNGLYPISPTDGYPILSIKTLMTKARPIATFRSKQEARILLYRLAKKNDLCAHYMGLESHTGPCSLAKTGFCKGTCSGLKDRYVYTQRLHIALTHFSFPKSTFLLKEEGRNSEEKFFLLVEDNAICTYGFLPNGNYTESEIITALPKPALYDQIKNIVLQYVEANEHLTLTTF